MRDRDALILLGAVVAVLIAASLVGFGLKRRFAADIPHRLIDNLNARVRAWWILVTLLVLAFMAGKTGVTALFAFASFAALREFITLSPTRRGDHYALAAAFFVVLPIQYWLVWTEWYGLYSIFIPVYAFLLLPIVAVLRGDTNHFVERIAELQWGLMTCVFCLSHVPALLDLTIPGYEGRTILLIAFLIIVVQASDVLQYVWGTMLGRRKVAPIVSPSKTWEGLIGGIACATLLGTGLWWITPFTPGEAALMTAIATLMGFCGGLVMSAIKRERGVKDWGHMIEGHGGVLDRLDSLVFAAPIFFHLTRYYWTI
jgi:phosphatidate cytidylyltransferase